MLCVQTVLNTDKKWDYLMVKKQSFPHCRFVCSGYSGLMAQQNKNDYFTSKKLTFYKFRAS